MEDSNTQSDYLRYRGKCREYSEAATKEDPTLRLARGRYYCPMWRQWEPHWWCVRQDGSVFDPTAVQFPSRGLGEYREFDGWMECSECGKHIREEDADTHGNYAFCSYQCYGRFVGVL